jgi:histidinol-phosphate aminotransferase
LGVHYWPSRANFVLFYLGAGCKPFIAGMRERGILVRDRSNDPGCNGCPRITVGTDEHNQRMLTALREVMEEIGVKEKVGQ